MELSGFDGKPSICIRHRYVSDIDMYQTWICIRHRYVSDIDMYQTSICVRHRYVSDIDMYQTWICIRHRYVSDIDMYQTSICIRHRYVSDTLVRLLPHYHSVLYAVKIIAIALTLTSLNRELLKCAKETTPA